MLDKLEQASKLFEDFTGHEADEVEEHQIDWPNVGLKIGHCDGVLYTTIRDGKKEHYIHEFKNECRPTLFSSFDGKKIGLIGGDYTFTERGITDRNQ